MFSGHPEVGAGFLNHQQYHLQQNTWSELWGYPSILAGRLRLLQSQKLWRISFSWASVENHKESCSNNPNIPNQTPESKKMMSDNDLDKMHFCETCTWKESHLFDLSRPTFDPHPTWMGLRTRDFPPDRAPSFKGLSPNHGRSSKSSKFGSPHIRKKSLKKRLGFLKEEFRWGPLKFESFCAFRTSCCFKEISRLHCCTLCATWQGQYFKTNRCVLIYVPSTRASFDFDIMANFQNPLHFHMHQLDVLGHTGDRCFAWTTCLPLFSTLVSNQRRQKCLTKMQPA